MPSLNREALLGVLLMGACAAVGAARAEDVTIYRCIDAHGNIALQDHACPKDMHQEVRQMMRPQDPPPGSEPIATAPQPMPRQTIVRVVRDRSPQPLYECTNANGDTYLSQSGVPQGAYAPLWTTGLGGGSVGRGGRMRGSPDRGTGQFRPGSPGQDATLALGPMVYVQDSCVQLPPDEVCDRLRSRNDALGTRIFNAQPTDRDRLERERKNVSAEMRNGCDD